MRQGRKYTRWKQWLVRCRRLARRSLTYTHSIQFHTRGMRRSIARAAVRLGRLRAISTSCYVRYAVRALLDSNLPRAGR